jgi:hypothetical protein
MALPNSEKITSQLATLPDQALKQMAMMHKADPYILPLIISEDGRRKQMRQAAQAQTAQMAQPKVADAALAQMGMLPEDQGIAQLPAPNIQGMADGGIAGYDDGGMALAQNSEPVIRMSKGGVTKMSGAELFNSALDMEGITDPKERAFLKALHGQESSGKATSVDSNRGAKGAMQILPATFKQVADKDMDITKPLDNMRAGIRYGKKGFDAAGGDPVLAGAYYYGGPGGMQKAAKGVAVSDPENPKAPTTLGYGKSIAQRMTDLLPIGSAQAGELPKEEVKKDSGYNGYGGTASGMTASGLAGLAGAYMPQVLDKFAPSLVNNPKALAQTVRAMGTAGSVTGAVPMVGGLLSTGAANALSNATPEQLEQLQGDIGSDTGFAAAIMNPENRKPENAPKMSYADQMANVGKFLVQHPDIAKGRQKEEQAALKDDPLNRVPVSPDEFGSAVGIPEPVQEKAIDIAKAAVPEKKGSGLSDDDYLSLGLRLMANKSRNLLAAVGEAGIGTLADRKEREKSASEKAYREAQTRYTGAYADAIERGAKEKNEQFQAESLVQKAMSDWDKNNKITAIQDPTARMREEERIRQQIYANLGLKPIMSGQTASSAANPDPLGILSKKG